MSEASPVAQTPDLARVRLPEHSTPEDQVLARLRELRKGDASWRQGRTFSLVYHAGDAHTAMLKEAYGLYFAENALSPMAFPSLRQMENEVVAMTAGLLGGDAGVAGTMTSGGSESLLLAVKTYRDQARAERPAITEPEMILPITAHPALRKAAHYLGVRPVLVPVDAEFRVDVEAVRRALTARTILIVGSAPAYPQGVMDPIEPLSELARAHGIGLHVDACLGGFLLPFLRQLGEPIPPFDFRLPGVTSISADLHKYGFAAKGASTILYRSEALRRNQFFACTDWPGGLFASTTMLGTRPGGAIAAAWAALMALGVQGYLQMAAGILKTTRALQEGIGRIADLRVLGRPQMSVFAFTAERTNLLAVADAMELRGWHIDRQQGPDAIHLMITPAHEAIVQPYLTDLAECVAYVAAHPELAAQGNAAMYGMLAQIPDRGMAHDLVLQHMGGLYR
jgi:glutamate/tyrosine decarboxylase-like PLP-dependent enzyme